MAEGNKQGFKSLVTTSDCNVQVAEICMFLLLNMKKGREKKNPKDDIEIYKLFIRQSLRINGYINGPMVAAYGNIFSLAFEY